MSLFLPWKTKVQGLSEGRVLAWHKDSHINSSKVIDIRDNNLYMLAIKPVQALLHDTINLSELWHKRLAHIHYRALPALGKIVTGLPEIQIQHKGVCKGCALSKNIKGNLGLDTFRCMWANDYCIS